MRILFATAEFTPVARVGGLAEATAGLVNELRRAPGVAVDVVIPDYGDVDMDVAESVELAVPDWAAPALARQGEVREAGTITLLSTPGMARPHPYTDASGAVWPDSDRRFLGFSAALAALIRVRKPDIVHINDWHTAAVVAHLAQDERPPVVLTVHTLGYQGVTDASWLATLPHGRHTFEWYGGTNPLAGALSLADTVIAVSPTYAAEIRQEASGMGLHHRLVALGDRLLGIRNGIDVAVWNPAHDPILTVPFTTGDMRGKRSARSELLKAVGWADAPHPIIGAVTRLVEQKGIDLLLDSVAYLEGIGTRLILLGAGDQQLADRARSIAAANPELLTFIDGYDVDLAHRIFAGSDLFVMPSRFEPCGLAQMQAMAYGTMPIVSPVGGLVDTVTDADDRPNDGTGFVLRSVDTTGLVDAIHRAVRSWQQLDERAAIIHRCMSTDWSWTRPAQAHIDLYRSLLDVSRQRC